MLDFCEFVIYLPVRCLFGVGAPAPVLLHTTLSGPDQSSQQPFGSSKWTLDEAGDAIHLHLAIPSEKEGNEIESRIMTKADEMNHHPHIVKEAVTMVDGSNLQHVTVTCTTHRPKGLSMRHARLAKAVDEIVAKYNSLAQYPIDDRAKSLELLTGHKRSHLIKIRDEIYCSICT